MKKKNILIACLIFVVMFFSVTSAFAQQVPRASNAIRNTLRGMNITIGNFWSDYNVNVSPPTQQWIGSESQEKQLDFRRRVLREYDFSMQEKNIATWGEMAQLAAISIMSGKPAATIFVLQPDWALNLYRQNLLYPVGSSRAVNWTATTPVEWNRSVTTAFTFKSGRTNDAYAFAEGYGGSYHAACVFFNKRLFREAGLNADLLYDLQKSGQWTWAKFLEISKQLTRDTNNDGIPNFYAMTADLSTEILDSLVSSNSANYIDKDRNNMLVNASGRPEFIEAVQFYMRLRDEGIMKPRTPGDNVPWDWYKSEFLDGRVAMLFEPQYLSTGDLRNMKDDWGMVLPPKGPRAKNNNYVVYNDENVKVIPAKGFTPAQVDAILWAYQAWVTPIDDNWRLGEYPNYRDRRAVDETLALIRDQRLWQWKYHLHVPGLNRGSIAWEIWWHDGEPAQLIEKVAQSWNALIADANNF